MYSNFQERVAALVKKAAEANTDEKSAAITLTHIKPAKEYDGCLTYALKDQDGNLYEVLVEDYDYFEIKKNLETILLYNEYGDTYYLSDTWTVELINAFKNVEGDYCKLMEKVFGI